MSADPADITTPYTYKYLACDISTTADAIMMGGILVASILLCLFLVWIDVPIMTLFGGAAMAFFAWNYAACMFGMNYLLIFIGIAMIFYAIASTVRR